MKGIRQLPMENKRSSLSGSSVIRGVEKILEEAQYTGVLDLSGMKLHDYANSKYELTDTIQIDLSRNRFSELPHEIYSYQCLERLILYSNVIRYIPDDIVELKSLVMLDLSGPFICFVLSRNHLSCLPSTICQLKLLEVLLVAGNKLISLPEEIGQLQRLTELDASSNELSNLPSQVTKLEQLQSLNVRRNRLIEIPAGLCHLPIHHLDISCNAISHLPVELHVMESLQYLRLDGNPLIVPPAKICDKGLKYVLKFLGMESKRLSYSTDSLHRPFSSSNKCVESQHNPDLTILLPVKLLENVSNFHGVEAVSELEDIPTSSRVNFPVVSRSNSIATTGHLNESNNEKTLLSEDICNNNDYDKFNISSIIVGEEEDNEITQETTVIDVLANDSEPEIEDVVNGSSTLLRPAGARGSFFEDILIEYNRSPRHGWESNEIDSGAEEQEPRSPTPQPPLLQGDCSDVSPSSDAEIETEVIQPRVNGVSIVIPSATSEMADIDGVKLSNKKPGVGLRKKETKAKKSDKRKLHTLDISNSVLSSDELRTRKAEISAAQRREAAKIRGRLHTDKKGPTSVPANYDDTHLSSQDLSADSDEGSELGSFNPLLTVRRHYRSVDEKSENERQLRKTIQDELKVVLTADTASSLQDGILLCELANEIHPRIVPVIYKPSQGSTKLSLAKRQKNVDNFLTACQKLRVNESSICTPSAILEGNQIEDIALTVQALLACGVQFRQSSV